MTPAARALGAVWPSPWGGRLSRVWTVVRGPPIDEVAVAAQAARGRAAGADPWLRLVFGVPSPLRDNGVRLAEELERAVAVARAVGSAEATFSVVREGTFDPAEYGFLFKRAAVAINGAAGPVEGFVLSSDALANEWARLDEFEGGQYERVATQVQLEDGQVVQAFVYQLKR